MKAESFAKQYVRTTIREKIDFWLFPVEAENYHLFTAEKWESEAFRQIRLFIDKLIQEGRIDAETIQPGSQPNLSQEMEELLIQIENMNDDEDFGELGGKRYTFKVNPKKSEVRPGKDKNGAPLLKEYLRILNNICKKDSPNFPEFIARRNGFSNRVEEEEEEEEEEDHEDHGAGGGDEDDNQNRGDCYYDYYYYYYYYYY